MYYIEYEYTTGDTNETYKTKGVLEQKFESIQDAKLCLKRMKEHYLWYFNNQNPNYFKKEKCDAPDWLKILPKKYLESVQTSFNTLINNEEVWISGSGYCGFFETLHSASIKEEPDKELSFNIY